MKLVSFIGTERCDFVYYLGRILSEISSNVIIIDNSVTHELFRTVLNSLDEEDENRDMVIRSNITYLRDIAYSPEFFPTFDYIIVQEGNSCDEDYLEYSDHIIAMPDCKPDTLKNMPALPENVEYILRDRAGKVNERSAAAILDIDPERIAGFLEYDAYDYAHYISLLYNGRQKLSGLSEDMIQGLAYITAKVSGKPEKEVLKALKKERRSKA